jgi:hypothetical protein
MYLFYIHLPHFCFLFHRKLIRITLGMLDLYLFSALWVGKYYENHFRTETLKFRIQNFKEIDFFLIKVRGELVDCRSFSLCDYGTVYIVLIESICWQTCVTVELFIECTSIDVVENQTLRLCPNIGWQKHKQLRATCDRVQVAKTILLLLAKSMKPERQARLFGKCGLFGDSLPSDQQLFSTVPHCECVFLWMRCLRSLNATSALIGSFERWSLSVCGLVDIRRNPPTSGDLVVCVAFSLLSYARSSMVTVHYHTIMFAENQKRWPFVFGYTALICINVHLINLVAFNYSTNSKITLFFMVI